MSAAPRPPRAGIVRLESTAQRRWELREDLHSRNVSLLGNLHPKQRLQKNECRQGSVGRRLQCAQPHPHDGAEVTTQKDLSKRGGGHGCKHRCVSCVRRPSANPIRCAPLFPGRLIKWFDTNQLQIRFCKAHFPRKPNCTCFGFWGGIRYLVIVQELRCGSLSGKDAILHPTGVG